MLFFAAVTKQKTILLVYARDNEAHCKVVRHFAMFLVSRCQCDVKLDMWCAHDISSTTALQWELQQIKSVNSVIIVHSEAGIRQYEAWERNECYEKVIFETPLRDTFLPAILEVKDYYLERKDKKFYNVVFPHSSVNHVVKMHLGNTYVMMKDIEELFLNIHGMTKFNKNGTTTAKEINSEEYMKCLEGRQLKEAMEEAVDFVKVNINWFDRYYQMKKTDANESGSSSEKIDSGICMENVEISSHVLHDSSFDKRLPTILPILPSLRDMMMPCNIYGMPGAQMEFVPPVLDDDSSVNSETFYIKATEHNDDYDNESLADNLPVAHVPRLLPHPV